MKPVRRPNMENYTGCEDPATWEDEAWQPRSNTCFRRPSSVQRLGRMPPITEFINWVESTARGWANIHEMFMEESKHCGGEYRFRSSQPRSGLTKRRWVKLLSDMNYSNEAGLRAVWDEIAKELHTDKKQTLTELQDLPVQEEISLIQLKRFERRACSVNALQQPHNEASPAGRFVKFLRSKYGSTLLAWRTVLDAHETGRVGYTDFMNGCKILGCGEPAKVLWSNVKKDKVHPMELHELDPKEGCNLEEFAELLWNAVGMDTTRAWQRMDPMNQNFLTYEQFRQGVLAFGFRGDVSMLFKGLDGSRLGRVKKEEFKYISKVSRIAQRRLGVGNQVSKPVVAELVSWVQCEFGGLDVFMQKLALPAGPTSVVDLAARLSALGFELDALEAASRAAVKTGGCSVTAESFREFLSTSRRPADHRPEEPKSIPTKHREHPVRWNSGVDDIATHNVQVCKHFRGNFGWEGAQTWRPSSARTPNMIPGYKVNENHVDRSMNGKWNDGIDDIAARNAASCRYVRGCFGDWKAADPTRRLPVQQDRQPNSKSGAQSQPVLANGQANGQRRAGWDDSNNNYVAETNPNLPPCQRKYFGDCSTRPVRDERREVVNDRVANRKGGGKGGRH